MSWIKEQEPGDKKKLGDRKFHSHWGEQFTRLRSTDLDSRVLQAWLMPWAPL